MARVVRASEIRAAVVGGAFACALALAALAPSGARGYQAVPAQPAPAATPSGLETPMPAATPTNAGPQPIYPPSPCASGATDCSPLPAGTYMSTQPPPPPPVSVNPESVRVLLGHGASARLLSPPSGIVTLSGFDANVVRAIFNPVDRTIDLLGLHPGTTQVTIASAQGETATLNVSVQVSA
ncbi:MAG: hypothetical protein JO347_02260, partial [Candidatus Eremiobacteraeota bacterium]|nr:hypothetical protein [Candidatus Eremiobacteraeota bacterium]